MNTFDPDKNWPRPYERPNDKWICGRTEADLPCRLGPNKKGRCQTTTECSPALSVPPGEQKGHYKCTRASEYGGPCSEGPLPSGQCSHSRPPCSPIRSWRNRRAVFTWWVVGLTAGLLLIFLNARSGSRFINPGPLSAAHSQPRGGSKNTSDAFHEENCSACHRSASLSFHGWLNSAAGSTPGIFSFAGFVAEPSLSATPMDAACKDCHKTHDFHHAAGIAEKTSCLSCHSEHAGDAGLNKRAETQCARCHGSGNYLAEYARISSQKSVTPNIAHPSFVSGFSRDHPEFSLLASKTSDTNSLRFNHQVHLSGVRQSDGSILQCNSCHEQDAAGAYHRPISYERHCQSCHWMQFDPLNPELHLPHGEVRFVDAFLASLPNQYERFGREARGLTERRALAEFVRTNMQRLQEQQLAGDNLRQRVFFNRDRTSEATGVSTLGRSRVAAFYGCAYCHEVLGTVSDPQVAVPTIPQRWLERGSFHHLSHQAVSCSSCHAVQQSTRTSDVLLPGVKTCAQCHNPKTAPGESCILCHDYHQRPATF